MGVVPVRSLTGCLVPKMLECRPEHWVAAMTPRRLVCQRYLVSCGCRGPSIGLPCCIRLTFIVYDESLSKRRQIFLWVLPRIQCLHAICVMPGPDVQRSCDDLQSSSTGCTQTAKRCDAEQMHLHVALLELLTPDCLAAVTIGLQLPCALLCRELRAFVFVFHAANRIVVETPAYGNATFFFEIEQPMPVAQQVRTVHSHRRALPSQQAKGVCLADGGGDVGSYDEKKTTQSLSSRIRQLRTRNATAAVSSCSPPTTRHHPTRPPCTHPLPAAKPCAGC